LQIEQKNVGKELITELAGFFAISGFSYNSEVFLRFENGTQAMPNDRVIVRYNHSYLLRRNLHGRWLTSVVKEREFSAHASQEKGRFARTAK
jgi:hypothetical protein